MKTERKTAALRRGMVLLCTLVLTLMAVTLPAEATLTNSLTDSNIKVEEGNSNPGTNTSGVILKEKHKRRGPEYSWVAKEAKITGEVKPQEWHWGGERLNGYTCSSSAYSSITIINWSKKPCILSFSYKTEGGTLTFKPADGANGANNGTYTKTLQPNDSVEVTLTTPAETGWHGGDQCQENYTANTTLSDITLKPLDENVSVELVQASNGSYTAKAGSTWLKVPGTHKYPAKTEYTFTSGAAAPNYVFGGWYVNGEFASGESTFTTKFASTSRVEAVFVDDPLLSIIKLGEGATGNKTDYVAVNSDYRHNVKGSNHTNVGDESMNNSYGPSTSFPDSRWSTNGSGGITSSTDYTKHGVATGDNQTSRGFSQAVASLYSDIIRVYCKENCIISFNSSMTAKSLNILNSGSSDDQYGVFLYYYTTASDRADANTIKTHGTAVIKKSKNEGWFNYSVKDSAPAQVVVNKGEYLYLYAYARMRSDEIFFGGSSKGYAKNEYSYSASISNFTVTPNNDTVQFTTRNTDNTGAALAGGTVSVNGVGRDVSKAAYTADLAKGTTLTLKSGNAPTGYTFIGWHIITKDGKTFDYTHDTYTVTLTEDYTVNPIYVPAMTITTGGDNGYGSATYRYTGLNGQTVTPTNLFVARGQIPDSGDPKFYTDLKTAFANEPTVFLLAGDKIEGDLTIPTGKTLVIPDRFAAKGPDLQTGLPEQYDPSASISSYCKVSYSGKLTVNGTLVVNARQSGAAGGVCGRATGGIGYLSLSDGATVTVKSGGSLFG